MTDSRGIALSPDSKKHIVSLKKYFDSNKRSFGVKDSSAEMTADALGFGLVTVRRVLTSFRKDPDSIYDMPKPKGRPERSIDDSHQQAVRAFVREVNSNGNYITLEGIKEFLVKEQLIEDSFHLSTLARTMDRWGFEFGKGTRTQHLKEKDHVVAARRRYLRRMRDNRLPKGALKRAEVYLDETYVNKNHSNDFIWYSSEDGPFVQKPTGNGERLIIVHAITKEGWVPDAKLVFKSSRKTGDYHGQMNAELFQKWFIEKLLPNIPPNSLIVMDNAPYHNVLAPDSPPTSNCSKARISAWLDANKIPFSRDCVKAELTELVEKFAPAPIYAVDALAALHGHEIVRTPPYHPELQPIETCWGVLKNEVGRNCDFSMKNLLVQLDKAFEKVKKTTCGKIIEKVRKNEDEFWIEDAKSEEKPAL